MLAVQWKWSRVTVLLLVLVAFVVPIWSVSGKAAQPHPGTGMPPLLDKMQMASTAYILLALGAGFLLAMHAWRTDHTHRHVYALSLPIPRWRYSLNRYAAALVFGAGVVAALWVGGVLAVLVRGVPEGLHAYPLGLALRFGFVMLVAFAVFFVLWSATARTTYYTAGALIAFVVMAALSEYFDSSLGGDVVRVVWHGLGMFEIFGGRWFLINV